MRWFVAWRVREDEGSGDDVMGRLGEWERCVLDGVLGTGSDSVGEESM